MEDKGLSVKEVARILDCSRWTVRRLLANGWICAPVGRPKDRGNVRISQKSVFQFLLYDRLSDLPVRYYRDWKHGRKKIARFLVQVRTANRFSSNEGTPRTETIEGNSESTQLNDPSPCLLPQGKGKQQLHHDFVVQHQFSFGWRARQLAKEDPALQDNLVQEMSVAVLEHDKPANFVFLLELAGNRAIDYLRYEALHGRMSLREAQRRTQTFAEKMANLNALIDQLRERGIPVAWIEEVLGEKLDVA